MTQAPEALSPTWLALRRMREHRLAIVGLWCVLAVLVGVGVIPWLSSEDVETTRPWIGCQPPLFSHPDCDVENEFRVGDPVRRAAWSRVRRIDLRTVERSVSTYRIVLRRGRVRSIQRGADPVAELRVSPEQGAVEIGVDGKPRRALGAFAVKVDEALPAGLSFGDGAVMICEVSDPPRFSYVQVDLAGGRVTRIVRLQDDPVTPLEAWSVRGENVDQVVLDGKPSVRRHLCGTDELGRDVLMRVMAGGRISLAIGLVATLISLIVGVFYGALSGYAGGRTDRILMGIVDIFYAVPFVFLVILLMVCFGRSVVMLFLALGAVQWLTMARIVRAQVLSLKEMQFVEAARVSGASPLRVVFRHIVPHTLGPVIVYTTLTVPVVIMGESFLAFIGLQPQFQGAALDSWGALIHHGVQALGQHGEHSWLLIVPSLAMVVTLFGLNSLGDGLRDCFDPKRSVF